MATAEIGLLEEKIWDALREVPDPEIPKLSVVDLGIIVDVRIEDSGITIVMTPTFSGCPAIQVMRSMIAGKVKKALGRDDVQVEVDYTTQWTSNRITEKGLKTLKEFGLAPPPRYEGDLDVETISKAQCPWCDSWNTRLDSPFGATLCRAIHFCKDCGQTFEQFKPL